MTGNIGRGEYEPSRDEGCSDPNCCSSDSDCGRNMYCNKGWCTIMWGRKLYEPSRDAYDPSRDEGCSDPNCCSSDSDCGRNMYCNKGWCTIMWGRELYEPSRDAYHMTGNIGR